MEGGKEGGREEGRGGRGGREGEREGEGKREEERVRKKEWGEGKKEVWELTVTTSPAASSQFTIKVEPYLNKQNVMAANKRRKRGGNEREGCVNSPEPKGISTEDKEIDTSYSDTRQQALFDPHIPGMFQMFRIPARTK